MQAGSPHMPTFFSTVEVEGVEFHGKGGRSKKQAEEDAAKIAYIALKECKFIVALKWSASPILLSCIRTTSRKFNISS